MTSKGNRIAIVAGELTLGSPAQQLLDRFLMGYARDGVFKDPPKSQQITIWLRDPANSLLRQRTSQFILFPAISPSEAVTLADAVLVFDHSSLPEVLQKARNGAPVFIYGTPANLSEALHKAAQRFIPIFVGTVFSVLEQLPPMDIPKTAHIREALIISNLDEMSAFESMIPILDAQRGGVSKVVRIRFLRGTRALRETNPKLLYAALSRTDKAQGNTLLDGRTEDISIGKHLAEMAEESRAVIIERSDRSRTTLLFLEGVIADILVAVQTYNGPFSRPKTFSTQLFQSPSPQKEDFSRLAAVISDYFSTSRAPWSAKRSPPEVARSLWK